MGMMREIDYKFMLIKIRGKLVRFSIFFVKKQINPLICSFNKTPDNKTQTTINNKNKHKQMSIILHKIYVNCLEIIY